jgi:hypothetical protein
MAIVKATYTRKGSSAKAAIRYMQHRPGKEQERMTRTLFGIDGALGRWQAYHMIDQAEKGSVFFRFVVSPDPQGEDTDKDLRLWEVTERTMHTLEERIHKQVSWVAVEHDDHAPHRHVHIVAVVAGRLQEQDFQALRQTATEACLEQRRELDLTRAQQGEEAAWERSVKLHNEYFCFSARLSTGYRLSLRQTTACTKPALLTHLK